MSRGMRSGAAPAAVALALWALAGATHPAVASAEPAVRAAAADTIPNDTIRGDTIPATPRERVLERIRERARAAAAGEDTVAVDTLAADTLGADTARVESPLGIGAPRSRERSPPPLPSAADSTMRALYALPGYTRAVYRADRVEFLALDRVLTLFSSEDVKARFAGQGVQLEADTSITYDDRTGRVRTLGSTLLIADEGDPVTSRSLIYDLRDERGTAIGARTTYREGANWIVEGDLDTLGDGLLFGTNTRFTSCELEVPHSFFEARELKVVAGQVLVARNVRMFVEDVPVMWLPFMAQNLGSGRTSGILTPTFSVNDIVRTSTGYNRRISNIGYYWAMSEYSDATIAGDWYSNNYTALSGSLRYRWARQFLSGEATARHYWQEGGGRELAFNTRHSWEASERMRMNVSARYVSSGGFVNRHSFDPQELNQTIDSDGGLTRRFDWGNLSLGANRRQFLNEDRVDMTLPSANLTISTITLFDAPPTQASWYNNMTMGGSMTFNRELRDRPVQTGDRFNFNQASQVQTRGSASGRMGLGRLSLQGRLGLDETVYSDVPIHLGGLPSASTFPRFGAGGFAGQEGPGLFPPPRDDLRSGRAIWSTTVSFQQNLIGSTTLTPSVSLEGELIRVDTIPEARDFVAGPGRLNLGVGLQTDLYAFFPGFGGFETIRHKVTPGISYTYSPEVTPTDLQRQVFGARHARTRNQLSLSFNQTWEAKLREEEPDTAAAPADEPLEPLEPLEPVEDPDALPELPTLEPEPTFEDEAEAAPPALPPARSPDDDDDGPTRLPESRVVTFLRVQTSAVSYDLVEADSTGRFVDGFTSTSLNNSIGSDYLQGLTLSVQHDLFDDSRRAEGGERTFAPHLSQLSLGFSLDNRSGLVGWLGRLVGVEPSPPEEEEELEPTADEERADEQRERTGEAGYDPNRIVPGDDGPIRNGLGGGTGWRANVRYSLNRPRPLENGAMSPVGAAQTLQWSLSFSPSPDWRADWSTGYDVEEGRFLDHMVSLRRDLHEWEATFGFRQTATGNWSFQFEVSLRANRDLRFDYEQRTQDLGSRPTQSPF